MSLRGDFSDGSPFSLWPYQELHRGLESAAGVINALGNVETTNRPAPFTFNQTTYQPVASRFHPTHFLFISYRLCRNQMLFGPQLFQTPSGLPAEGDGPACVAVYERMEHFLRHCVAPFVLSSVTLQLHQC